MRLHHGEHTSLGVGPIRETHFGYGDERRK